MDDLLNAFKYFLRFHGTKSDTLLPFPRFNFSRERLGLNLNATLIRVKCFHKIFHRSALIYETFQHCFALSEGRYTFSSSKGVTKAKRERIEVGILFARVDMGLVFVVFISGP